jgi:drug/metabolite transporter (DMT)-like permease
MSVLLALLSSALWGTADFIGGTLTRRWSPFVVVGWSQAAGLVTAGVVVLVVGTDRPWGEVFVPAFGAAMFGYVGLVLFYTALARGTMGVVAPITALGGAVPVAAGLLRGEEPSTGQLIGLVVALVGVFLASGPELSGRAGALPILLAGAAAAMFGGSLLLIADGSERDALATVTTMRAVTVTLSVGLLLVALLRHRATGAWVARSAWPAVAAVGVMDIGANLTFGLASNAGLLTLAAAAGSLYPVATVLLARFVHHERLARIQQVGVVLALAGVALIAAA